MASEQIRTRKKKARNLTQEETCRQILYRHQDCIPDPKLLHSCEKHRLFGVKSNQQDNFEHKLLSSEELSDLRTKQLNTKPKNTKKIENRFQETELNPNCNSADKTNEELSKSRKRRIRKRRLLTSLAPLRALTNRQSENIAQAKPDSNTCPSNGIHSVPIVNNINSDLSKTSPKNFRKRFDKSVTLRNKNIKSKTLVDCTNQSKSDIIKSIEEKTLNSLLQTLAPLTNASPKKEKIPTAPIFSFPEKRLNLSNTKVDKEGVFYFGETKHQLEKLTLELNKCSTSAQNNQLDSNSSINKLNNTANCGSILNDSPSYNDSLCNITQLISTDLVHLNNLENIVPFSFSSSNISPTELEIPLPYQENQNPLTSQQPDSRKPDSFTSSTSLTSAIVPSKSIIVASENINKSSEKTQHICNTSLLKLEETNIEQKETKKESSVVKSSNETMKTNKTREEVLLEREAKKAAKIAAKSKNKSNQNKKDAEDSDTKNTNSSKTVKFNNKETIVEDVEIKPSNDSSTPGRDGNKLAISDQVLISSENKMIREEVLVDPSTSTGKVDVPAKSKAELKAERRAKQEAQRAAKALSRTSEPQDKKLPQKPIPQIKHEPSKPDTKSSKPSHQEKKSEVPKLSTQPKPKLFTHLYQEKSPASSNKIMKLGKLHPAIVRLGVQYATRVVVGSNARCVALLHALKQMIKDYSTPSEKEFSRGLEEELGPVMVYLNQCRPLAVSMTNAIKHIKRSLVQLPNTISDVEARRKMRDLVDTYIHEQIDMAGKAICESVGLKIANGDVILTYGCSSLVCQILVESHLKGKKFRVVVVDGLPWQEGREMLRRLVDKGVSCTYVLISAASFIMREASKVLLGAHALLANGYVMSRAGSSQVALLAHCYNVPVLVCCETHKFSERVQTDAFVYNELGELCCDNIKDKDSNRVTANLTPLSLAYDITPPDLVSAVVTERAILPCTSVPVILRIKPSESVM